LIRCFDVVYVLSIDLGLAANGEIEEWSGTKSNRLTDAIADPAENASFIFQTVCHAFLRYFFWETSHLINIV
jgi:hypothetical protein